MTDIVNCLLLTTGDLLNFYLLVRAQKINDKTTIAIIQFNYRILNAF